MPSHDPAAALAAGLTVVTPNNRLARTLIARHDAAMVRAGKRAWPAASVLPWSVWAAQLWRTAVDADVPIGRLAAPIESRYLWQRIVADDPVIAQARFGERGVAELCEEAWRLVHGWGAGGPSWRAWRDSAAAPAGSDVEAFSRWAEQYLRELGERDAIDDTLLADALASALRDGWALPADTVVLAGFLELSPQQARLVGALRDAGVRVLESGERESRGEVGRIVAPTPRDEIVLAMRWARERALSDPRALIGVAVNGLGARREEVVAIAEDVLCPELVLPGHAGVARPYDVSLGVPLADDPVVASAVSWLALAHEGLDRAAAAALFRSPYGPGAWTQRARFERTWIEESRDRVTFADALAALSSIDASAAARLREAKQRVSLSRAIAPGEWVAQWRTFLSRCGWPGATTLAGPQHEAREAFARALESFTRLDGVAGKLAPAAALRLLRDELAQTIFQPQGSGGPVAILGILEAASVTFDALWVAGLSGQDWPPAPQPNPLLPVRWLRERGVPRSSASRELAFATHVTERLMRAASHIVVSAPAVLADTEARPTALVEGAWPGMTRPDREDTARAIARARAIEAVRDDRAPPLPAGPAPGGSGAIESQSNCPFMAMARYRLRAEPWPDAAPGLSPLERGTLAHAMMATFWREVRSHERLVELDEVALAARIEAAASEALATIPASRWATLPPVMREAEKLRLPGIACDWIEAIERPRNPFTVARVEESTTVELGGLVFRLKLDRIDTLADGTAAIVDYKTGLVDSTHAWFAWRPRAPQLGVYMLALANEPAPVPVRAMAYGRLKADEIAVVGFAADLAQWGALQDAAKQREPAGWQGIERFFHERLPAIAGEIRDGLASVTPRAPPNSPCRICCRQSLCRIDAVRRDEDAGSRDDGR
jgi:ATP-dependent helicase/nuclease subunit B